jgi:xanthine dehydrogenase accessory factor
MRELFSAVDGLLEEKKPLAVATVIRTWGSSPRRVGSKMLIEPDGSMVGSVSGGCVETEVVMVGIEVIETGSPRLLHFGVANEAAWDVGLACGGKIDVFVQRLNLGNFNSLRSAWDEGVPIVRAVVIKGPENLLGCELVLREGGGHFDNRMAKESVQVELLARQALSRGRCECKVFTTRDGETVEIFLDVVAPMDTLVIIGGVHIATFLVRFAHDLGYRTVIIDPRKKFANRTRFPQADKIIQEWPQEGIKKAKINQNTAVAVLTHDPKIDDPALQSVLTSPAFYVGALGSRQTQSDRRARLLEAGISESDLERLHGPVGLDLGGQEPAEIALGIMAEIVQVKNGTSNPNSPSSKV